MSFRAALALVGLAVLVGCDAVPGTERPQPYAPWETGLTLVYERPDLPAAERMVQRIQIRVEASRPTPEGFDVELSTASLQGMQRKHVRMERGCLAVMDGERVAALLLPEGFPERAGTWQIGPMTFSVVGRAQAPAGLPNLPESSKVGVWVEAHSAAGERQRVLYLPGIGEAETLRWREGRWEPVLRLVSRGFTDPAPVRRQPVA